MKKTFPQRRSTPPSCPPSCPPSPPSPPALGEGGWGVAARGFGERARERRRRGASRRAGEKPHRLLRLLGAQAHELEVRALLAERLVRRRLGQRRNLDKLQRRGLDGRVRRRDRHHRAAELRRRRNLRRRRVALLRLAAASGGRGRGGGRRARGGAGGREGNRVSVRPRATPARRRAASLLAARRRRRRRPFPPTSALLARENDELAEVLLQPRDVCREALGALVLAAVVDRDAERLRLRAPEPRALDLVDRKPAARAHAHIVAHRLAAHNRPQRARDGPRRDGRRLGRARRAAPVLARRLVEPRLDAHVPLLAEVGIGEHVVVLDWRGGGGWGEGAGGAAGRGGGGGA